MPNANEALAEQGQNATDAGDNKPLTLADLKALLSEERKETARIANAAIVAHNKREADKAAKAAAAKQAAEQEAEGGAGEGQGGGTHSVPGATTPDPEVAKLRKEIETLKAAHKTAEKKAIEAQRRAADEKGHAAVKAALTGKVAAGAESLAFSALRDRKAFTIDDDGNVRMRFGDADEPEEGLDLAAGVEKFLKTKEAEFLRPAPKPGTQRGGLQNGAPGQQGQRASPFDKLEARTGKSVDELL